MLCVFSCAHVCVCVRGRVLCLRAFCFLSLGCGARAGGKYLSHVDLFFSSSCRGGRVVCFESDLRWYRVVLSSISCFFFEGQNGVGGPSCVWGGVQAISVSWWKWWWAGTQVGGGGGISVQVQTFFAVQINNFLYHILLKENFGSCGEGGGKKNREKSFSPQLLFWFWLLFFFGLLFFNLFPFLSLRNIH